MKFDFCILSYIHIQKIIYTHIRKIYKYIHIYKYSCHGPSGYMSLSQSSLPIFKVLSHMILLVPTMHLKKISV